MSVAEHRPTQRLKLGSVATDVIEIAALRGRAPDVIRVAAARGLSLPALGAVEAASGQLAAAIRPDRWLVLAAPTAAGERASAWTADCAGVATVVDLSSGLAALHLAGAAARDALARGCRIDLDPLGFPPGRAAATIVAQAPVTILALTSDLLLLTPTSLAQHVTEWLTGAATSDGDRAASSLPFSCLSGERRS